MAGVAGRSGRKPKPVVRKIAAGNPGKRALNMDQPDFELVTTVHPPEWMDGPARELWETIAPLLCEQRVLQATDIQNLEIYCDAYGQFRAAVAEIAGTRLTLTTPMGSVVKNPALTAKKEAVGIMNSYGAMLGLDPASRQRLIGPKKPNEGNPFAGLLPR